MGIVLESNLMEIFAAIASAILCLWIYYCWCFTYWKKRGVTYLEPHFPWGTWNNFFTSPKSFGETILSQYRDAKQNGHRFLGLFLFTAPVLMPLDPLLVNNILATNFPSFMDRGVYFNEKADPLSAHLFAIEGMKWRNLRAKLTPTFTSGKIKMMFDILRECGDQMYDAMKIFCETKEPVDIKDVLARFTTNVIGSAAFGLECNTFVDVDSDFRKYGKKIFLSSTLHAIKSGLAFCNRHLARRLNVRLNHKDVCDFFIKVVKDTIELRRKNNIQRNDFMQLLINLKDGASDEKLKYKQNLTFEELAAQAFLFFIAGYETSSTTMTFCLFELSLNLHLQDKVRLEVLKVLQKHGGKITYESINEMKYLEQVINETLRKYPPLPILNRLCTKDFKIPNTDVVIEKGTAVFIPVLGLQNDANYFPNPDKFDPERFNETNKRNIVPYTYLPFGEGPRTCIGLRFGLLQTKVGLAVLLQNFKFSLNSKTKVPLTMDPASFIQSTLGDMWLNVEKVV